jgi:hypothetical protein
MVHKIFSGKRLFNMPWKSFNAKLDTMSDSEKGQALAYAHGYISQSKKYLRSQK